MLLLEKTAFPREKVCGDGLTPRAVKQLVEMGIDISEEAGWLRNKGLRVIGGGVRLELDWPDLASFPDYGLVRTRVDFDELLARQAQKAGAGCTSAQRRRPDPRRPHRPDHRRRTPRSATEKREVTYRAPLVVAADGNSARLSARDGPARARRPADGRGGPDVLTRPGTTTTTWSRGWSCGTAAAPRTGCCPATAGSSAWATARRTSASAC